MTPTTAHVNQAHLVVHEKAADDGPAIRAKSGFVRHGDDVATAAARAAEAAV